VSIEEIRQVLGAKRRFAAALGRTLTKDGPLGMIRHYPLSFINRFKLPFETSGRASRPELSMNDINNKFGDTTANKILVPALKSALLNSDSKNIIKISSVAADVDPIEVKLYPPSEMTPRFSTPGPALTFKMPQTDKFLDYYSVSVTEEPSMTSINVDKFYMDEDTGKYMDRTLLDQDDPRYLDPNSIEEERKVRDAITKDYIDEHALPLYVENFINRVTNDEDISYSSTDSNNKTEFAPAQLSLFATFLNDKMLLDLIINFIPLPVQKKAQPI